MFYCAKENKYINEGCSFEIDSVQYPSVWLNQSTPEQKAALGLEEVVATNQPYNPVYYWTGETLDGATLTYTGTPKNLDEVKLNAINQIKQTAYTILQPTDYIEVRNLRDPSYKPEWITWRDSVRATCDAFVIEVNACRTVDKIAALSNPQWPLDPSQSTV